MRGLYAHMIGEHEPLVVEDDIKILLCKEHPRTAETGRGTVAEVGEVIDERRNDDEKERAEAAVPEKAVSDTPPGVGAVLGARELYYPVCEPDGRKPRPGVQRGPLARRAQAEEHTGERKVRPRALFPAVLILRDVEIHEPVHEDDEEHRVGVDGGETGLDKMHEVKGENGGAAGGHSLFKHAPAEEIQRGQHEDAEQRPGEAPAEGRQPEDPYAQRDD